MAWKGKKQQASVATQRRTRTTVQEEVEYPPPQENPIDEVAEDEMDEDDNGEDSKPADAKKFQPPTQDEYVWMWKVFDAYTVCTVFIV